MNLAFRCSPCRNSGILHCGSDHRSSLLQSHQRNRIVRGIPQQGQCIHSPRTAISPPSVVPIHHHSYRSPTMVQQDGLIIRVCVRFSFSLAHAGMPRSSKVKNLLVPPLSPHFDPSLALVAISRLLPNILAWMAHHINAPPTYPCVIHCSSQKTVDEGLVLDSAVFGIGWDYGGICHVLGIVVQGAFGKQWKSIGMWVLGLSVGGLLPGSS
jgi:hypothetical protein